MFLRIAPLLALLSTCAAYHVLVVFPMMSRSHGILGAGIVKPLLEAGHEVTYLTPFPIKDGNKNLHNIDLSFMAEFWLKMHGSFNIWDDQEIGFSFIREMGFNVSSILLESEPVQKLLMDKNKNFDAVITEWFFSDLYVGISKVLQCPWLVVSSMGMHVNLEYLMDEVQSPAVSPAIMTGFSAPMSLHQRIINSAMVFTSLFATIYIDHPREGAAYKRLFAAAAQARGVALPEYTSAVHDIALLFVNSHASLGQATRLPPNAVEIGGYHIDPVTAPLPEDLQKLLDNASEGVIYFSMGSNLKSSDLSEERLNQLLDVFRGVKQTVLWKFETELKSAPKNVHIRPWFPQPSILAHKNVIMFITHGGLLSTTEAIHFGVPLIGIPVFGDQPMNMDRAVKKGYALKVDLKSPQMGKDLDAAIKTMLLDPSYGKTAKRLSQLFHDRPSAPARLVSYWTEDVVRTGGAKHLRTAANSMPANVAIAYFHVHSYGKTAKRLSQLFHDRPSAPARLVSYWTEDVVRTGGAKHLRTAANYMLANVAIAYFHVHSYGKTAKRLSQLFHDRPSAPARLVSYWTEDVVRTGGAKHLRTAANYMLANVAIAYFHVHSYGKTAKRLSQLFHDRPSAPARLVSYWTEDVVRTGGAKHLRTAANSMPANVAIAYFHVHSYGKTAKRLSQLFHDRPSAPARLVSYWTEDVVRTGGAKHLRTAANSMPANVAIAYFHVHSYGKTAKRLSQLFHDRPSAPARLVSYWTEDVVRTGGAKHLRTAANYMLANVAIAYFHVHSYGKTAKRLSQLFHDRPSAPARLVSYWTEDVVRTGGAKHLRTAANSMPANVAIAYFHVHSYGKTAKRLSQLFHDRPSAPARLVSYWTEDVVRKGGAKHLRTTANSMPAIVAIAYFHVHSYGKTAKRLSQLFHDRPNAPARLVSYWTEHVVRTGGAKHLRTAATSVPAYQRYLLDILALIIGALSLVIFVLRTVARRLFGSRGSKSKKKTN